MSPTDVEEILAMEPFKPMRFTLSSGDPFVVDRQFRALVHEGMLYVSLDKALEPGARRNLRLISTVNIAMVERLDSTPPPPTSRGRRRK